MRAQSLMTLAVPLEKHLLLKSAGTHQGEPLIHPLANCPIVRCHQSYLSIGVQI